MLLRYLFHLSPCQHCLCPPVFTSAGERWCCSEKQLFACWVALLDSLLMSLQWVTGYRRDEPSRTLNPIRHPNGSEISNLKQVWIRSTIHQTACCGLRSGGLQQSGYWVRLERSFCLGAEGETGFPASFLSSLILLALSLTSQN